MPPSCFFREKREPFKRAYHNDRERERERERKREREREREREEKGREA